MRSSNQTGGPGSDPRRVLMLPAVYRFFGALTGQRRQRALFAQRYVRAQPNDRILDVGCGPGDLLVELPKDVAYVGFDMSERYVRAARQRFGNRGTFFCRKVDRTVIDELGQGSFDLVVAHGVLHHLDDRQASDFFGLARAALRAGGRLVTGDGCFVPGQSRVARYLLAWDRGAHVRSEAEYVALASQSFSDVTSDLQHNTAHVPYTMIYLACS